MPRSRPGRAVLGVLTATAAALLAPAVAVPAAAAPPPPAAAHRTDPGAYVAFADGPGRFPVARAGRAAPVVVDDADFAGVRRAAADLAGDVAAVTGVRPTVSGTAPAGDVVLVGTIGRSPLIDGLVARGKLDVRGIAGKWETSLEQVVTDPLPGVRRALVLAGSDQRGTIYAAYDLSRGIGVSPWAFWDDVTPAHRDALYVRPGRWTQGTPAVKYRGFFLNDENPALGRWAPRFFGPGKAPGQPGGLNSAFYAQVFETMLRLRANYLWPAVWGRAFAEDDPANHATAGAYGVVMGTSHEAPMMRGIEEWNRHARAAVRDAGGTIVTPGSDPYGGTGEWSFRRNRAAIVAYWRDGLVRMRDQGFEGVVTLGMRGNGDVSLPDGDAIPLMQDIIATQRGLIKEVFGSETAVPQVWTLYKEVQRYWDEGLRVPDDVIVTFTDDNWGNLRRLPSLAEPRPGGYGLYYHFDYVGVGRNYKWVDTANLANVWDQLHQTAAYGGRSLWVANAGDLKSNELPTQFFLDYAWDPQRWPVERLGEWERRFAAENFGGPAAPAIADLLHDYGQLQARRKPELLNRRITVDPAKDLRTDPTAVVYDDQATPFSLVDYRELARVTDEWERLAARAAAIGRRLPARSQDAYFELVHYAVRATANLYRLREAEFTNIWYAGQGRAATNRLAAETEARFAEDQALSRYYNTVLAGGKWDGFQTQPHIGYGDVARYGPNAPWQQPELNNEALPDEIFPAVRRITLPAAAALGVAIEGSTSSWPAPGPAVLPVISRWSSEAPRYLEVVDRGAAPLGYRVTTGARWLTVSRAAGTVREQARVELRVDWARAPRGTTRVPVTVTGSDGTVVTVQAVVENPTLRPAGWLEAGGYVAMEAGRARVVPAGGATWKRIPDLGRTGAGMEPWPVTAARRAPGPASPRLEFPVTLTSAGPVDVHAYLSPRNNAFPTDGLKYAVSIDGATPQVVDIVGTTGSSDLLMNRQFERNTSDNVNRTVTRHAVSGPGRHVVRIWMVDPTVVVQRVVLDTGGLRPSYLGPPESRRA